MGAEQYHLNYKKISGQSILGQQGINLIENVVLGMGFAWHTTNQSLEVGLDGFIELRNAQTGEALNSIVFVQSRATDGEFTAETESGFDYLCDERDLDYWLRGNAPIILVRCRPKTNEAYWVSIKDYFTDLAVRASKKIHFRKTVNRFDASAKDHLVKLSVPENSGFYLAAEPKRERLYCNLLRLERLPPKIYIADTQLRHDWEVKQVFRKAGVRMGGEWFLKDKKVFSFHDLSEQEWATICDQGTAEGFDTAEWAYSIDELRRKDFVRLLKLALDRKLHHLDIEFHSKMEIYFFRLPEGLKFWKVPYRGIQRSTSRRVVEHYTNKNDPARPGYYRHLAFAAQFFVIEGKWYLQLTPTHYYTRDGKRRMSNYEGLLSGMKRMERNSAVLGQTFFLGEYLSRTPDLFRRDTGLQFAGLVAFESEVGVNDEAWLQCEEDEGKAIKASSDEEFLFEP
jgi:hypothetical protein